MIVNNNYMKSINKLNQGQANQISSKNIPANSKFGTILSQKINENEEIKFSKHAEMRLKSRDINLTDMQMGKIKDAVNKASQKGVKDSLVMVDNIAFVVSIKNRTVVTAVDSTDLKENVFTNIDGAVFG